MPRDWTAYEASMESVAFSRWAEEFLDELQARVDFARALLTADSGLGEGPHEALQAIKTLVNDEERGIS